MSKNDLHSKNRTETIPEFQRKPKEKCKRKIGCGRKRKTRIKRANSKKKQENCGMKSQLKTRYFLTIILFNHIHQTIKSEIQRTKTAQASFNVKESVQRKRDADVE